MVSAAGELCRGGSEGFAPGDMILRWLLLPLRMKWQAQHRDWGDLIPEKKRYGLQWLVMTLEEAELDGDALKCNAICHCAQ